MEMGIIWQSEQSRADHKQVVDRAYAADAEIKRMLACYGPVHGANGDRKDKARRSFST